MAKTPRPEAPVPKIVKSRFLRFLRNPPDRLTLPSIPFQAFENGTRLALTASEKAIRSREGRHATDKQEKAIQVTLEANERMTTILKSVKSFLPVDGAGFQWTWHR